MKIAHIGLASYFTEGMTYQDNYLSHQNALDGHEVLYVSNAAKYQDGVLLETGREDKILPDGVRLVRLPYEHVINRFVSGKFRKVKGLYKLLEDFGPDVILSHDLGYWSVLDVIRYKKNHPEVKFYADTHTDAKNSGTNWLSLHVLHRIFYRYLAQRAVPYLEKYLSLAETTRVFSVQNHGIPNELIEFYPLGGTLFSEKDYTEKRTRRRMELGLAPDELLLVHSGKMDALKKTDDLLKAFASVPELKAKLVIIGSIPDDRKALLTALMEADSRVRYLGWRSSDELLEYLCACDLYCQPGSPSVTMQSAVCCYCPVLLDVTPAYQEGFDYGNILWVRDREDIVKTFRRLAEGDVDLAALREGSETCARELLDYRKLAARLYR